MHDELVAGWQRSGRRAESIAADMATKIRTGRYKQYQTLPPNIDVAQEYGVSKTTVINAKRLLAEHEILAKDNGVYIVA
jgi:DNA-binding GntR family transcriptional regulator